MAENDNPTRLAEQLKLRIAEQEDLRKRFEAASPANDYKEEVDLGEEYTLVTEFRMNRDAFIVEHIPTRILNLWSAMTGPRALKGGVEGWVDEIQQIYPPKQKS